MNEAECKLKAVRKLASYISTWLYSVGPPPDPVNKLFIRWVDDYKVPTMEQVNKAITKSELTIKRQGREGE